MASLDLVVISSNRKPATFACARLTLIVLAPWKTVALETGGHTGAAATCSA